MKDSMLLIIIFLQNSYLDLVHSTFFVIKILHTLNSFLSFLYFFFCLVLLHQATSFYFIISYEYTFPFIIIKSYGYFCILDLLLAFQQVSLYYFSFCCFFSIKKSHILLTFPVTLDGAIVLPITTIMLPPIL